GVLARRNEGPRKLGLAGLSRLLRPSCAGAECLSGALVKALDLLLEGAVIGERLEVGSDGGPNELRDWAAFHAGGQLELLEGLVLDTQGEHSPFPPADIVGPERCRPARSPGHRVDATSS